MRWMTSLSLVALATIVTGGLFTAGASSATEAEKPAYETANMRITPRSAVTAKDGDLHVVVVLENTTEKAISVSMNQNFDETYAFDDTGVVWRLQQGPKGIEVDPDACGHGTGLQPGETRPVLLMLSSRSGGKPKYFTFGTALFECAGGEQTSVPVSIDGVPIQN